jgi:uncharacterized protein
MEEIMLRTTSGFNSERASRYLQQMSKHFAHKVTVEYNETDSVAAMPGGATARMAARGDRLIFTAEAADEATLARCKDIIESHIVRFAFREKLTVLEWSEAEHCP